MAWGKFSQHPHERGELTYSETLALKDDYERAGRPESVEGLTEFLGSHPRWSKIPVDVFLRTLSGLLP